MPGGCCLGRPSGLSGPSLPSHSLPSLSQSVGALVVGYVVLGSDSVVEYSCKRALEVRPGDVWPVVFHCHKSIVPA